MTPSDLPDSEQKIASTDAESNVVPFSKPAKTCELQVEEKCADAKIDALATWMVAKGIDLPGRVPGCAKACTAMQMLEDVCECATGTSGTPLSQQRKKEKND